MFMEVHAAHKILQEKLSTKRSVTDIVTFTFLFKSTKLQTSSKILNCCQIRRSLSLGSMKKVNIDS